MKIQNICDWLLVFFIHEVSEYRLDAEHLLDVIKHVGSGDNNEVWVIYEQVKKKESGKAVFQLSLLRLQTASTGHELVGVPIWQDKKQDRNTWKEAIQFIYANVLSQRKILFTWSHGAAFGINIEEGDINNTNLMVNGINKWQNEFIIERRNDNAYLTREEVSQYNNFRMNLVSNMHDSAAGSDQRISYIQPIVLDEGEYQIVKKDPEFDCKKIEVLWMSDLAELLRSSLDGKPLDMLIMMNCNMQLFENGYMLREVADVLIGPESKMVATGYDYEKLLRKISSTAISNEDLAKSIISDYVEMHIKLGHRKYLATNALFANKLEPYNEICGILQNVTGHLLKNIHQVKPIIQDLKDNYFNSVSGLEYIFLLDLSLWLETVFSNAQLAPADKSLSSSFVELKNKAAIKGHVGDDFIYNDQNNPKKYGYSGFSLFFPPDAQFSSARRVSWCQYFSQQLNSPFQIETDWDEFINALNPAFFS